MMKILFYIPKRNFVRQNIKSNVSKGVSAPYFNLFWSHVIKEENSQWIMKLSDQFHYIAHHPKVGFDITVLSEIELSPLTEVYSMRLNPIKNWLFMEKDNAITLKDSYFALQLEQSVSKVAQRFLDMEPNPMIISDLITNVRPTAHIIRSVDLNAHPVTRGKINIQGSQIFFIPHHAGFPKLLLTPSNLVESKNITIDQEIFCEILKWDYGSMPIGRLLDSYPLNYNQTSLFSSAPNSPPSISTLSEGIPQLLKYFNLKDEPFSEEVVMSLKDIDENITTKDLENRINFMNKCVISIDPVDAKDLDDALHIEKMSDGNFEVGVHIADVSHYVKPSSPIDIEASQRTTTVYLIHKVIPMLPELLSERVCSLNPNEKKLTFSVIFIIRPDGTIVSERFVKSYIKPKFRLNYDEADKMIEGDIESLPMKNCPGFKSALESVQMLDKLAKILKTQRLNNGALSLDTVQLKFFTEDSENVCENDESIIAPPTNFVTKVRRDSSFLIEEWMLLANQAAARLLYNYTLCVPKSRNLIGSLLRYHPAPDRKQKMALRRASKAIGKKLDSVDSATIQQIISEFKSTDPMKSLFFTYMTYFNMQLAMYCCAEKTLEKKLVIIDDMDSPLRHFGLSVPLYTHFTSPIRRYADLIVHRQISAILNDGSDSGTNCNFRNSLVGTINEIRPMTKRMYEELLSRYLASYLSREGYHMTTGVILTEWETNIKIFLPLIGLVVFTVFADLAPWALKLNMDQNDDTMLRTYKLKYCTDPGKYKVHSTNGFMQYVYEMSDNGTEIGTVNNEDKATMELFEISIAEPFQCCIFCDKDELKLSIEIPFPSLASQLTEESRHL